MSAKSRKLFNELLTLLREAEGPRGDDLDGLLAAWSLTAAACVRAAGVSDSYQRAEADDALAGLEALPAKRRAQIADLAAVGVRALSSITDGTRARRLAALADILRTVGPTAGAQA